MIRSRLFAGLSVLMTASLLGAGSASAQNALLASAAISSSADTDTPMHDTPVAGSGAADAQATPSRTEMLWKHPGVSVHIGINGAGLDIAEPIAQHFNIRIGGEYLRYTGDFTDDGAQIHADLAVGGGKAALDYYPWHNGWRISPQVRFAIQTEANVNVIVPAGQQISLDGGDYNSSPTDPLRGTGYVNTRKAAAGISIGYGNISPRHGAHWSFPTELGFYYIGQPHLNVTFTGSACDPTQPVAIGCQSVTTDAGFQSDLKRFIARQNNNLSYASFFPIASFGVGYRF